VVVSFVVDEAWDALLADQQNYTAGASTTAGGGALANSAYVAAAT
jgi:hypothetical protein